MSFAALPIYNNAVFILSSAVTAADAADVDVAPEVAKDSSIKNSIYIKHDFN